MSEPRTMSAVVRALMPKGSAWFPANDGDLDKLIESLGTDAEDVRAHLEALANVRDPLSTTDLEDLEIELGVVPDEGATEAERRAILAVVKSESPKTGSVGNLQAALRAAGFDVYVYANNPLVDPNDILMSSYLARCGYSESRCGNEGARCGRGGGFLVVNGEEVCTQTPLYTTRCGYSESRCGNAGANCGAFSANIRTPYAYVVPEDWRRWPFVFFIGGQKYGWEHFNDWRMEWHGTTAWTSGNGAGLSKSLEWKTSGIRSLRVQTPTGIDPDDQTVQPVQETDLRAFYRATTADPDDQPVENLAEYTALADDEEDFE